MTTQTETAFKTYSFTFTLGDIPEIPAEVTDAEFSSRMDDAMDEITGRVLAAGCDDATLSARGQTFFLGFDREAGSLGDAIGSAVKAIEGAGFAVVGVDMDGAAKPTVVL